MSKISLNDFGLTSMSSEYKREFLYCLDYQLRNIHNEKGYIGSFNYDNVYIDDETHTPIFEFVNKIPTYFDDKMFCSSDIKNEAVFATMLYMGSEFQLGVAPNIDVFANNFDLIKSYFPEEDVDYYRDLFEKISTGNDSNLEYFSNYVDKKIDGNTNLNSKHYTKSTSVGRSMANDENGNINYLFIVSLVCTALIMFVGLVISFINFS